MNDFLVVDDSAHCNFVVSQFDEDDAFRLVSEYQARLMELSKIVETNLSRVIDRSVLDGIERFRDQIEADGVALSHKLTTAVTAVITGSAAELLEAADRVALLAGETTADVDKLAASQTAISANLAALTAKRQAFLDTLIADGKSRFTELVNATYADVQKALLEAVKAASDKNYLDLTQKLSEDLSAKTAKLLETSKTQLESDSKAFVKFLSAQLATNANTALNTHKNSLTTELGKVYVSFLSGLNDRLSTDLQSKKTEVINQSIDDLAAKVAETVEANIQTLIGKAVGDVKSEIEQQVENVVGVAKADALTAVEGDIKVHIDAQLKKLKTDVDGRIDNLLDDMIVMAIDEAKTDLNSEMSKERGKISREFQTTISTIVSDATNSAVEEVKFQLNKDLLKEATKTQTKIVNDVTAAAETALTTQLENLKTQYISEAVTEAEKEFRSALKDTTDALAKEVQKDVVQKVADNADDLNKAAVTAVKYRLLEMVKTSDSLDTIKKELNEFITTEAKSKTGPSVEEELAKYLKGSDKLTQLGASTVQNVLNNINDMLTEFKAKQEQIVAEELKSNLTKLVTTLKTTTGKSAQEDITTLVNGAKDKIIAAALGNMANQAKQEVATVVKAIEFSSEIEPYKVAALEQFIKDFDTAIDKIAEDSLKTKVVQLSNYAIKQTLTDVDEKLTAETIESIKANVQGSLNTNIQEITEELFKEADEKFKTYKSKIDAKVNSATISAITGATENIAQAVTNAVQTASQQPVKQVAETISGFKTSIQTLEDQIVDLEKRLLSVTTSVVNIQNAARARR